MGITGVMCMHDECMPSVAEVAIDNAKYMTSAKMPKGRWGMVSDLLAQWIEDLADEGKRANATSAR